MSDERPEISSFSGEYRFLSNFAPSPVTLDGDAGPLNYPSVEHAYQAAKTLDLPTRVRFQTLRTAGLAKRAGRSLLLRPDWEEVKVGIMRDLLTQKFRWRPLMDQLLATKGYYLREGNTWNDRYWGCVWNPGTERWEGENHLGLLLMELRDKLLGPEPEVLPVKVVPHGG